MRNVWRGIAILVFVVYPIVELLVAIWIAQQIGWTWVILLTAFGFVVGVTMLRRAPVSAVLIAIPGFVTDLIGLILLITPIRRAIGAGAMNSLRKRLGIPEGFGGGFGLGFGPGAPRPGDGYLPPDPDHPVVPGEVIDPER